MPSGKSYSAMVASAIAALKDHEGSSRAAIAKYLKAEYAADNAGALKRALKKMIAGGKLEYGATKSRFKLKGVEFRKA